LTLRLLSSRSSITSRNKINRIQSLVGSPWVPHNFKSSKVCVHPNIPEVLDKCGAVTNARYTIVT
jgi:hypothetical protein